MKRGEMLTGRSVSGRWRVLGDRLQVSSNRLQIVVGLLFGLIGLIAMLYFGFGVRAANGIGGQDKSVDGVWQTTRTVAGEWAGRSGAPESAAVFKLDESALRSVLANAPLENKERDNGTNGNNGKDGKAIENVAERAGVVVWLPMPGGEFARFRVVEAPVMKPELAELLPDIKSYRGWGIDDGRLTMRCDLSPLGFHAAVTDGVELMAIHSVEKNDREHYVSYSSRSYAAAADAAMCLVNDSKVVRKVNPRFSVNSSIGTEFREYEIAVATTQEFTTQYGSGTLSGARAAINSVLTGLQVIYDRELSIGLTLVSTPQNPLLNDQVIAWSGNPISFTNGNADVMVNEVRGVLRDRIGVAEYDFGLVLGTGTGGGSAYVGVVCETASDSFGPYKGGGAVLIDGLLGAPSNIALAAHEIGHQFGATHTQNANCGARVGDSAWESGSGMTLMSNAGQCGADNIASARSSYFHSGSFEQIIGFITVAGGTCADTQSSNGNSPPTVDGGAPSYVIPKQTPFALTAMGNDPDGDALTYSWEQVDAGRTGYFNPPYLDTGDQPLTTRPIFRPYDPASSWTRLFPKLSDILSGQNGSTFENLPQVTRRMNFRVTARAQTFISTPGGVANDSVQIDVDGNAGPFTVTSPNTSVIWPVGIPQLVTWNVNNTGSGTLVNCANVKISLSTDGGQTFSTLVASTPNTGSAQVILQPNTVTSFARIKVEAISNIFFDISDVNFNVTTGCAYSLGSSSANFAVSSGTGSVGVTGTAGCAWIATSNAAWITVTSGASGTGNGTVNYSVAANTGAARSGTITIAGQTFTVNQAGVGMMFYPLAAPVRLLETRPGQSGCSTPGAQIPGGTSYTQVARGTCGIPANAVAVIGNITTVQSGGGYLTVYPSNNVTAPNVASSYYLANQVLNNVFTVGLGPTDGAFKIFVSSNTHVVVDITGYYALPSAGLYFHPLPKPIRLLETRTGQSGCFTPGAPLGAGTETTQQGRVTCDGVTIPNNAMALVGNATTVNPQGAGWLTFFPADAARPWVSSANYTLGQVLNTPFTVGLSAVTGQFKIYTLHTTNLVVDVVGYYSSSATDINGTGMLFSAMLTPMRLLDTQTSLNTCFTGSQRVANTDYVQSARGFCSIGSNATGIVGTTTVFNPGANGWLTYYPSNVPPRPWIATLNYTQGQVFNRHFTVALGTDGAFINYSVATTHLAIDVFGYFAP
ncbi:MAG: reprolysin-like metallopeptidase [Blastocatellia bacterium]